MNNVHIISKCPPLLTNFQITIVTKPLASRLLQKCAPISGCCYLCIPVTSPVRDACLQAADIEIETSIDDYCLREDRPTWLINEYHPKHIPHDSLYLHAHILVPISLC